MAFVFAEGILFMPNFLKKALLNIKCCIESVTQMLSKEKANANRSGPATDKVVTLNKNGCVSVMHFLLFL